MKIDNIKVGDTAEFSQKLTDEIIHQYGEVSGDYNPIHFDDVYAKNSVFKERIAHGLFCIGMISYLVGMVLPGEGAIFIDEQLKYIKPVYIGDEIKAQVWINDVNYTKKLINVGFECTNQNKLVVLEGTTRVLL